MSASIVIGLIATASETIGTVILGLEVWRSLEAEEHANNLETLQLRAEILKTDQKEFFILAYMDGTGVDRGVAEKLASELSEQQMKDAIEKGFKDLHDVLLPQALRMWRFHTTPAVIKWRRKRIIVGTGLVILGGLLGCYTTLITSG